MDHYLSYTWCRAILDGTLDGTSPVTKRTMPTKRENPMQKPERGD